MRKFIAMAIAFVGMMIPQCFAANPDVTGTWRITWENGEPAGDINNYTEKIYSGDGKFYVIMSLRKSDNVYGRTVVQRGDWEMVNDSTIVEKCEFGNKGYVGLHYKLADSNTMVETFMYKNNLDKVYIQKLERADGAPVAQQRSTSGKVKYYTTDNEIPGVGSFGPTDGLVYFIGDTRYSDFKDFKAACPEASKIESFSVLKDRSACEMLTEEEKAAGKNGIFIVKLKE